MVERARPRKPKIEIYTPERKAEFLLANAVGAAERRKAAAEVRKLTQPRRRQTRRRPS